MPKNRKMIKSHDPRRIFNVAESFRIATLDLAERFSKHDLKCIIPYSVNLAFALELFLKCLITIEKGETPEGHKTEVLFSELSERSKKRTIDYFENPSDEARRIRDAMENFRNTKIRFEEALARGNDTFRNNRYLYEHPGSFRIASGDIIEGVRFAIMDHHPEWAEDFWNNYPYGAEHTLGRE